MEGGGDEDKLIIPLKSYEMYKGERYIHNTLSSLPSGF